jgi:hypothetical protein
MLSDAVWTLPGVQDITDEIRGAVEMEDAQVRVSTAGSLPLPTTPSPVEVVDPVVLIRIPQLYENGMAGEELYDCTRGIWKIGVRREGAKFAFAVMGGVVLEVYEIAHWQPAGTSSYLTRKDVAVPGRWEFIGRVAPEAVRTRYLGRSVKAYLPLGFQNPVRYVNC